MPHFNLSSQSNFRHSATILVCRQVLRSEIEIDIKSEIEDP